MPIGLGLVAEAARRAGHEVRLLHLQVFDHAVLNQEHRGWGALETTFGVAARDVRCGRQDFVRMPWQLSSVYDPVRQLADQEAAVRDPIDLPRPPIGKVGARDLYGHRADRVGPRAERPARAAAAPLPR